MVTSRLVIPLLLFCICLEFCLHDLKSFCALAQFVCTAFMHHVISTKYEYANCKNIVEKIITRHRVKIVLECTRCGYTFFQYIHGYMFTIQHRLKTHMYNIVHAVLCTYSYVWQCKEQTSLLMLVRIVQSIFYNSFYKNNHIFQCINLLAYRYN